MKTLIVYASKFGCTKECVYKLKDKLDGEVNVVDATKNISVSLSNYDNVILGGSIYLGQLNKKLKSYITDNISKLQGKNIGLFIVCGFTDEFEEVKKSVFPQELLNSAKVVECFGGKLNVDKMGFMYKKLVRVLEKKMDISNLQIISQNIDNLAIAFNQ